MNSDLSGCSCAGKNLDKLVKPVVMAILAQKPSYGYAIVAQFEQLKIFGEDVPDISGIYRILKELESFELVTTQWDLASNGPAKRIYELTENGRRCLQRWDQTLDNYLNQITLIRQLIRQQMPDKQDEKDIKTQNDNQVEK